jgi:hypothetical protein
MPTSIVSVLIENKSLSWLVRAHRLTCSVRNNEPSYYRKFRNADSPNYCGFDRALSPLLTSCSWQIIDYFKGSGNALALIVPSGTANEQQGVAPR